MSISADGKVDDITDCLRKMLPFFVLSIVARYVIALATAFNKFYHDCTILQAEDTEKMARLLLTDLVQKVLYEACGLLGMECPEEMYCMGIERVRTMMVVKQLQLTKH